MTKVANLAVLPKHDHLTASEWEGLWTWRYNVLLEGPKPSTDSFVQLLVPHLPKPLLWNPIQMPYALLARDCGALVLQNVGALSRAEQVDLLRWINESNQRRQVISTSARPLFPLVASGLFDDVLYYRLNVMLLRVS